MLAARFFILLPTDAQQGDQEAPQFDIDQGEAAALMVVTQGAQVLVPLPLLPCFPPAASPCCPQFYLPRIISGRMARAEDDPEALEAVNKWADLEKTFEMVSVQAWNAVMNQVGVMCGHLLLPLYLRQDNPVFFSSPSCFASFERPAMRFE